MDDPFGQDNVAVTDGKAIQASVVVPDETVVRLTGFSLDANIGTLVLSFDDIVAPASLNVSSVTIQDNPDATLDGTSSYTLTDSSFQRIRDGSEIQVSLSLQDLNGIKSLLRIGSTLNDTYLSIADSAATDSSGNVLIGVPADAALRADTFEPDAIRPTLTGFQLDLNQAALVLTFSETLDVGAVDASGITLQNLRDITSGGANNRDEITSLRLTSGVLATLFNSDVIRVGLLDTDFTLVTMFSDLGTFTNNTFLSLTSSSFSDTTGNRVVPVSPSSAFQATDIIADVTLPMLTGFDFSLNRETITLTFTEAVDVLTLDPTSLTVQETRNGSEGVVRQLTGGEGRYIAPQVVELRLNLEDIRFVKASPGLAVGINSVFVSLNDSFIMDYSDNFVVAVPSEGAVGASTFVEDESPPRLLRFDLDLSVDTITAEFDETIDPASANVTLFSLIDSLNFSAASSIIPLRDTSNLTVVEDYSIEIVIDPVELNQLKALPGFSDFNSTFLRVGSGALQDVFGNTLEAQVIPLETVTPDDVSPTLESYAIDYDANEIRLTFSEIIDPTTFNVSGITLQGTLVVVPPGRALTLRDSVATVGGLSPVLRVQLRSDDATALKRMTNLATDTSNTFLLLTADVVTWSETFLATPTRPRPCPRDRVSSLTTCPAPF